MDRDYFLKTMEWDDRAGTGWTDYEDWYLRKLLDEGNSIAQVAGKLKRTVGALNYRLNHLEDLLEGRRNKGQPWEQADLAFLKRLSEENKPIDTIAKYLGRSRAEVVARLEPTPESNEDIFDL